MCDSSHTCLALSSICVPHSRVFSKILLDVAWYTTFLFGISRRIEYVSSVQQLYGACNILKNTSCSGGPSTINENELSSIVYLRADLSS
ncbi:hypothetical protein Tsubulata_026671 [Turnera subulata]|uniref:Uncharacterized protein n=1 Tax=Turnera subulata TaxID=218843 RepID=A0A9Q0JB84_9ROSI|nr:hypothetical protein Tsubulata_026671 [Turnera subulata]